jgi:hypothetical protein
VKTIIGGCPLGATCEEAKTIGGEQVMVRCPWYTKVKGHDNVGKDTEDWGCAIAWMPALLINSANESRKGAIATESFRNEMVKEGERTRQVLSLPVFSNEKYKQG